MVVCLVAIIMMVLTISVSISPQQAHAKTLAQFDAEITAQEQVVQEKSKAEADARRVLEEATAWYYKNVTSETLADILTGQRSVTDAIDQMNCMDSIYETYAQKAAAAAEAKADAKEAQDALRALRDERAGRARSLDGAKQVQFPQSKGMPWSGFRYWRGTVARSGCGLCAYTVVIDVLCGRDYTPTDMLQIRGDWCGMDGFPDDSTGAGGRTHAELTRELFDVGMQNIDVSVDALRDALRERESVAVVCAQGSAFKNRSGAWRNSVGHFVTVIGYDEEGFHVSDSAYTHDEGADVIYSDAEMQRMVSHASSITLYTN